jgi:hypothetical protein
MGFTKNTNENYCVQPNACLAQKAKRVDSTEKCVDEMAADIKKCRNRSFCSQIIIIEYTLLFLIKHHRPLVDKIPAVRARVLRIKLTVNK